MEFFNGQFLFCNRAGAAENYKFLSPSAVTAAFRNAPVDSGWLSDGVVRCGGTGQGDFAVIFIPAQRTKLHIESAREKLQPFSLQLPSLVFFGLGQSFYVWAVKDRTLNTKSQLFRAPLPNVFANNGICWGTNQPPRASSATIVSAWLLFITSPFNGHAANNKSRTQTNDIRPLLRRVARSRRRFPLNELVAAGGTLDANINRLIGGLDGNQNGN